MKHNCNAPEKHQVFDLPICVDTRLPPSGSGDLCFPRMFVCPSQIVSNQVGARCLSLAGPTVAQFDVFFSSDYL